eukprot:10889602-Prorocentrum_lima.AAC.1
MVGMEVPSDNMWVVSPPCSGLSKLARKTRTDSAERDQYKFRTTQIQMAWITQRALQDDQRHYPEVQSAFPLLDYWERDITGNQN